MNRSSLEEEGRWLSTDEQFFKVKDLFDRGGFCFLYADFSSTETLKSLGEALKIGSRQIDTIYESNIGSVNYAAGINMRAWFNANSRSSFDL